MKTVLRKIMAVVVAFIVLALISSIVAGLEDLYRVIFPDFSDVALANIEATSNIAGLVLAVMLSIKTYKRLATKKDK